MDIYVFEVWVLAPLLIAAVPQSAFVLLYGVPLLGAGRWWRDEVGRALFFKSATFAAVMITLSVRTTHRLVTSDVDFDWSTPKEWQDWFGAVLYWLVLFAICYQLWILVKSRLRERTP